MAALSLSIDAIRPLNRWDNSSIRPGSVGSVGDVLLTPRYAQSSPDMPLRFDPYFRGKRECRLGSNVQNGTQPSYDSGGLGSRTIDSNWGGRRNFKVRHGYIFQDMRAPDKLTLPLFGSTPNYSYNNRLATVYEAKTRGEKFLPLPGGYLPSPGEVTRGGAFPHIHAVNQGTLPPGSQGVDIPTIMNPQTAIGEEAMKRKRSMLSAPVHNKRMK